MRSTNIFILHLYINSIVRINFLHVHLLENCNRLLHMIFVKRPHQMCPLNQVVLFVDN
jgi:hypothetical protein